MDDPPPQARHTPYGCHRADRTSQHPRRASQRLSPTRLVAAAGFLSSMEQTMRDAEDLPSTRHSAIALTNGVSGRTSRPEIG